MKLNIEKSIDYEQIKKVAEEAAQKTFLEEVKKYYDGYDSPYREAIRHKLAENTHNVNVEIPEIIQQLNLGLSNEVDRIANEIIGQSYIREVTEALTRLPKKVKLSSILWQIMDVCAIGSSDMDRVHFESIEHKEGWVECKLRLDDIFSKEHEYQFTLHRNNEYNEDSQDLEFTGSYSLLRLPTHEGQYRQKFTVIRDNTKLELPFSADILSDRVIRMFCRMLISACEIDLDIASADELFQDRD